MNEMKSKEIYKMYLARVIGEVKGEKFTVDKKIKCITRANSTYGVCEEGDPEGKECVTDFELIFYDKETNSSLLRCYPKTGRTH